MNESAAGEIRKVSLRFGVAHDFRCPPGSPYSLRDVYAQTMEQITELDRLGLDLVWFSEHHFLEDGYLPAFVPVAGAAAALTTRMRISTNISIVPFHHPLRLAEDLAVLDQLSNGRMEFGIGLGYVPKEFEGFRIPIQQRVSRTEECIEILRLAWSGRPFSYHGKRWDFDDIRVTPEPVQPGGPPLWLAVSSEPGVHASRSIRHARFAARPSPVAGQLARVMRAAGADPSAQRVGIIRTCLVTDDPERDWPPLRDAERYRMRVYSSLSDAAGAGGRATFDDPERITQRVIVGDVDHCATELISFIREFGLTDVVTWGSAPGFPPAAMMPSMERFTRDVVPLVRAAIEPP